VAEWFWKNHDTQCYFLELGANVAITSRDLSELQKTTEELLQKMEENVWHCNVISVITTKLNILTRGFKKFGKVDDVVK
jgi:hypothetical protein